MRNKKILRNLLFPPKCAACRRLLPFDGAGGEEILCNDCRTEFEMTKIKLCRKCAAMMPDCRCMPESLRDVGACALVKLAEYRAKDLQGVINRIVNNNKRFKYPESFDFLARQLSVGISRELDELETEAQDALITFCPRSKYSRRVYGFDQAEMLAVKISDNMGIELHRLLSRHHRAGQKSQKKLNYSARAANIRGSILYSAQCSIEGKTVILVDDVVTSGATMAACTALLIGAGAKNVLGVCIAAAAKENR